MKRIAILGANGQVGTEVCLFLSFMPDVEPVPICRSSIGAAYLRRCGLDVRVGHINDENQARYLLNGCDVVADFSLPVGSTIEVKQTMRRVIPNLARYAPDGAQLVYLSSITAFGIPDFHQALRFYRISRNRYGSCKRYGEKVVFASGRRYGRATYVLRLGVVHGELQAVSRKCTQDVRHNADVLAFLPEADSYTIFAFTIAEALAGIAHRREEPGLFTAVSHPAWSWEDIYMWYAERVGACPQHVVVPPVQAVEHWWQKVMHKATQPFMRTVVRHKDFLSGYVAALGPALEQTMRAGYHRRMAAAEIAAALTQGQYWPYGRNYSVFPGQRLRAVTDSRVTMRPYIEQLREITGAVGECQRFEQDEA